MMIDLQALREILRLGVTAVIEGRGDEIVPLADMPATEGGPPGMWLHGVGKLDP